MLFSNELAEGFIEVTQREKFKKYFNAHDVANLFMKIKKRASFITSTSLVSICRDPKDNFLLSLAIDGKATHLITGDNDLLVLKKLHKTIILKITDYISEGN